MKPHGNTPSVKGGPQQSHLELGRHTFHHSSKPLPLKSDNTNSSSDHRQAHGSKVVRKDHRALHGPRRVELRCRVLRQKPIKLPSPPDGDKILAEMGKPLIRLVVLCQDRINLSLSDGASSRKRSADLRCTTQQ